MVVSDKFLPANWFHFSIWVESGLHIEFKIRSIIHVCYQTQIAEHVFSFFAVRAAWAISMPLKSVLPWKQTGVRFPLLTEHQKSELILKETVPVEAQWQLLSEADELPGLHSISKYGIMKSRGCKVTNELILRQRNLYPATRHSTSPVWSLLPLTISFMSSFLSLSVARVSYGRILVMLRSLPPEPSAGKSPTEISSCLLIMLHTWRPSPSLAQ
jgi:hypothetical protein